MTEAARQVIATLGLQPLPLEGGYFRETHRTATFSGILFLLTPGDFSALHRLAQDEVWHFHAGDPVEHVQIDPRTGTLCITRLGPAATSGDTPGVLVPAGHWQGARVATAGCGYALLSCTVSPPWDDAGFGLADRAALLAAFPELGAVVTRLTR